MAFETKTRPSELIIPQERRAWVRLWLDEALFLRMRLTDLKAMEERAQERQNRAQNRRPWRGKGMRAADQSNWESLPSQFPPTRARNGELPAVGYTSGGKLFLFGKLRGLTPEEAAIPVGTQPPGGLRNKL